MPRSDGGRLCSAKTSKRPNQQCLDFQAATSQADIHDASLCGALTGQSLLKIGGPALLFRFFHRFQAILGEVVSSRS